MPHHPSNPSFPKDHIIRKQQDRRTQAGSMGRVLARVAMSRYLRDQLYVQDLYSMARGYYQDYLTTGDQGYLLRCLIIQRRAASYSHALRGQAKTLIGLGRWPE